MLTTKKLIIFGAIAFMLVLITGIGVYFLLFGGQKENNQPVVIVPVKKDIDLEIWGLFDDRSVYDPIIEAYKVLNPRAKITYKRMLPNDYEVNLINAIASGKGPDIFYFSNNWINKHFDKLSPTSIKTIPSNRFIRTTSRNFISNRQIYGVPLNIDNLALFYNKDLFALEGLSNPPRTWQQFTDYSEALTQFSSNGKIIRSGSAMGTFSNINRASDILLTLMMQNGVNLYNPFTTGKEVLLNKSIIVKNETIVPSENALKFYTNFANPSVKAYSWNESQDYSIDAFIEGKVAMMFNYAYNINLIKERVPYLNFATAPLPVQPKSTSASYANYYALSVSRNSSNKEAAWDFIKFLTSQEMYPKYFKKTSVIPAQQAFIEQYKTDPLLRPFIDQLPITHTPYLPDQQKIERFMKQAIDAVNSRTLTIKKALEQMEDRLNLIIR